jgi:hypothetical protein
MDLSSINFLAVVVAALSSFLIGGLWYSPILFARAWMRETGLSEEELGKGAGRAFGGAFVLSLIVALNLAMLLGGKASITDGLTYGALAGVGFSAAPLAIIFLFERRSTALICIDGGYQIVAATAMGLVLGAWP